MTVYDLLSGKQIPNDIGIFILNLLALSIGQRLCVNFYVSGANFLTTCVHTWMLTTCSYYFWSSLFNMDMVVYCVVTEANLDIMSCRHDTYPSRHYAGCCLYPDGLEFYRILYVITLPHFGHVGSTMSTCDDMSAK
jgi:hypothetical protein